MWWKVLSVLLIVYSIVAGMLIPLKPGIVDVSPRKALLGETITLSIEGYNSRYSRSPEDIRVWLKLDSVYALTASRISVISDLKLEAEFLIPEQFKNNEKVRILTLIVDDPVDGVSLLPRALTISSAPNNLYSLAQWDKDAIKDVHFSDELRFPYRNILNETIRSLYYHVPLWFGMIIILAMASFYSLKCLLYNDIYDDYWSFSLTAVGTLYGLLGLLTGAIWANYTWGAPWSWDVKQNMSAIAILMYMGYFLLRDAQKDEDRKQRISAIYNIFSFVFLIPLLFVIPRMVDSLHPGNGGNPGLGSSDLDHTMRMVFYPAIVGFTILGYWISQILFRIKKLNQ